MDRIDKFDIKYHIRNMLDDLNPEIINEEITKKGLKKEVNKLIDKHFIQCKETRSRRQDE